jgi:UDP-sugar transporter A1/2/3
MRHLAFVLLVLQNTLLLLCLHLTRLGDGPKYAASTTVLTMEVLKFAICVGVGAHQNGGVYATIRNEVFGRYREVLLFSIPAFLYVAQNNLLYFALSRVGPSTYQLVSPARIIAHTIFSVLFFKKRYTPVQWLALVVIAVCVWCVLPSSAGGEGADGFTADPGAGFAAALISACLSGLFVLYLEKTLKSSGTSLWVRNIQMGVSSIIGGVAGIYLSGELDGVRQNGFFYGYNNIVVMVILLQAVGGLVVAVAMRHIDNSMRRYAGLTICMLTFVVSYVVLGYCPTRAFVLTAVLANVAALVFGAKNL